jgi:hypothetical protein
MYHEVTKNRRMLFSPMKRDSSYLLGLQSKKSNILGSAEDHKRYVQNVSVFWLMMIGVKIPHGPCIKYLCHQVTHSIKGKHLKILKGNHFFYLQIYILNKCFTLY